MPASKSHDISPSILDRPIRVLSTELPTSKRAKFSRASEKLSIASLITANAYSSIEELSTDLDSAIASVKEEIQDTNGEIGTTGDSGIKIEGHPDGVRAASLKQEFNNLIMREMLQRPHLVQPPEMKDGTADALEVGPNKHIIKMENAVNVGEPPYRNTILTIFGGSGQPKQLFSSSLKRIRPDASDDRLHDYKRPRNPINDIGLPNGITITSVVPVHSQKLKDDKKGAPTIGELFAPPSTLAELIPPTTSKHTYTKSAEVNWNSPAVVPPHNRPSRRSDYASQQLITGHWLAYNGPPSPKISASTAAKRKQRERALSISEHPSEPSEDMLILQQQAREESMFRSIYSGFAPDRDNDGALVTDRARNRLWWKKYGERKHLASPHFPRQVPSIGQDAQSHTSQSMEDLDGLSLEEAIETWKPEDLPPEMQPTIKKDDADKDTDEILQEVSQLLEVLSSHQSIRNLSLNSNARTSSGQNPQPSPMSGTPTSPSSDEFDVYQMLKSQLTIMISSLPPYVIAKLDGDKLGALSISTKIQMETANYKGTLQEDEYTARSKQAAQPSTPGYSTRLTTPAVGLSSQSRYLASPNAPMAQSQRPGYMASARPPTSTSYLPNQQYSRPASASQYYGSNARSSYPAQRSMTGTSQGGYGYGGGQQYSSQSTARPAYNNGANQYPSQNGTSYSYARSQQSPATTRPTQPGYAPQGYANSPSPAPIPTSGPSAPAPKAPMQYAGYSTQGSQGSSQRPPLHQQHSSQYSAPSASSPQVNGSSTAAGSGTPKGNLTANEQAVMINSQKSQLTEHTGAAARQGSGTPQPANGNYRQQNGASGAEQNGVKGE